MYFKYKKLDKTQDSEFHTFKPQVSSYSMSDFLYIDTHTHTSTLFFFFCAYIYVCVYTEMQNIITEDFIHRIVYQR